MVIVAASAGGIEAVSTVLRRLAPDLPVPVVVIQHIPVKSALVEVFGRASALPVSWAWDGGSLEPGRVVVCAPLSTIEIHSDRSYSLVPWKTSLHPIDRALEIAASSFGKRLLVVILTGMLSDGSRGARSVSAAGGTVIAQSDDTAEQPAMPLAAVETGAVDLVVPLSEIGGLVGEIVGGDPLPDQRDILADADARRAEHERLRAMVSVPGVGILVWDPTSGRLLDANDVFLEMSGYTREEIEATALSWRDMTPEPDIPKSERELARLARTGRIGPYEKGLIHSDGSVSQMIYVGAAMSDRTVIEYCIGMGRVRS